MWEYKIIKDADMEYLEKMANTLGEEGWEGFGFASTKQEPTTGGNHMIAFKREIEETTKRIKHSP